MKIYIAGPMSGYKDWNFPAFFEAERQLTEIGYEVVNPAHNDGVTVLSLPGTRNGGLFGGNSYGGGSGVMAWGNATTVPTSNPTGGGVMYVGAGALSYIGTSGSAATIVNADGTKTLDGGSA